MSQGEPFRDAALAILKGLPDFKSLSYLELGCGDGFILDALHQAGAKVRGTRIATAKPTTSVRAIIRNISRLTAGST